MRVKALFQESGRGRSSRRGLYRDGTRARAKRESAAEKKRRARIVTARLARAYPVIRVPLNYGNTFQLLVATVLSAQCTDEAVNKVTPELFRRYPIPATMAQASSGEIEEVIHSLGLFRAKARSLIACARQLVEEHGGEVPSTMEELTRLKGVGRKTANVVLGYAFDTPGVVVDTHCKRLSRRLGFTRQQEPQKIEKDLMRILPPEEWTGFSHRLIIHGRRICHARKPRCRECVLSEFCPSSEMSWSPPEPGDDQAG